MTPTSCPTKFMYWWTWLSHFPLCGYDRLSGIYFFRTPQL